MSQQNWKFLSPLPNGTPVDVPIATGDTLEQSLYKLQGQQNISKENIDLIQKNNKGVVIIDMNNADYVMTEEESKNGLIIVTNNESGASVLTIYDGPNTPRDITIYSVTNENYTLSLAGGNAFLTMLNVGKSKIFYIYAPGGNSIASGFTYVPYDGSNLLTPGTACKFDYNEYGLITHSYVIGKSDVGLSNVDNTSDINKPISTAVQTALDGKVPTYTGINGYTLDNNIVLTKTDIGLQYADNTSDVDKPISTATQDALDLKEDKSNKGQPNGYAGLDSNGKVPTTQLPTSVLGTIKFKGTWNANTNVITSSDPAINNVNMPTAESSNEGWYFIIGTAGTTGIITDRGTEVDWKVGDWILSLGTTWSKIDNTDLVLSVNGKIGTVVLDTSDLSDTANKRYVTDADITKLSNLSGTNSGDQTITLTSDITGTGTGSFATTIANNVVTNAKAADMATQTIKGRNTAGTGDPEDLSASTVTSMLNVVVGDSGSGGTKGLVPQPIAGDANKILAGNGSFTDFGSIINSASSKTTPVNNDQISLMDSGDSNALKKLSWSNIKATLKTYFDALYLVLPSSNGIAVRTSSTTSVARSIDGVTGLTSVINGDGVSGNPTLSVSLATANVNDATDRTTTSTSYVTLGAPIRISGLNAGTYFVIATSCIGSSSSNVESWMGIHSGTSGSTTLAAGGEMMARPLQGSAGIELPITCHGICTITGGQVIEPKWKTTSGTLTVYQTTMHAIRIG
jgi:hypothetical protein